MKASGLSSIFLGLGFIASLFFYGTDSPVFAVSLTFTFLTAAVLLISAAGQGFTLPRSPAVLLAALFGVYLCAVLPFSAAPYLSALFTLVILSAPLLFLSFSAHPQGQAASRTGLAVVLGFIVLLAAHALVQFFFFHAASGGRAHSVLLDPNTLAVLLNMLLMPLSAGFLAARERRAVLFCGIAAGIVFAALLATQSRGGLISCVAGIVSAALILKPQYIRHRILNLAAAFAGILAAMHLADVFLHGRNIAQVSTLILTPGSVTDRLSLWDSALAMLRAHPLTGTGLGTFAYFYGGYRLPMDRSDGYFVHMDPLQLGVETGIAATVIFYALAAGIVLRTMRAIKSCDPQSPARIEIAATFAALLAAVLHSHIYFHLYMPVVLLPLACLLAVWHFATAQTLPQGYFSLPPLKGWRGYAAAAFILIAALAPLQWTARTGIAAFMIRNAAAALYNGDVAGAEGWIVRAGGIAPRDYFHVPQYRALAALSALQAGAQELSADEKAVLISQGLRDLALVDEYNRTPAFTAMERAAFYGHAQDAGLMLDGYERAAGELQAAVRANPRNFAARTSLAAALVKLGRFVAAKQVIEDGLEWPLPPGAEEVNYLIAVAEMRQRVGDEAGAQDILRRAAERAQAYGLMKQ